MTTFFACGNTYPVKETLKGLGARWNRERRAWEFATEPAQHVEGVTFVPSPLPEGWIVGSGYAVQAGVVFVRPLSLPDKETREYKRGDYHTSLGTWFVRGNDPIDDPSEDLTLSRPVNDEEWAALLAKREVRNNRTAVRESFVSLVHATGNAPKEASIPAKRIEWNRRSRPDYLARDEQSIYLAHYNGADGDDWSFNNCGGYVVWVAPRSAALDAAYDLAAATFEGEE